LKNSQVKLERALFQWWCSVHPQASRQENFLGMQWLGRRVSESIEAARLRRFWQESKRKPFTET
jgi:hypothetical protein